MSDKWDFLRADEETQVMLPAPPVLPQDGDKWDFLRKTPPSFRMKNDVFYNELQRVLDIAETMPEPKKEKDKINDSVLLADPLSATASEIYEDHDMWIEEAEKHETKLKGGPFGAFWKATWASLPRKELTYIRGWRINTPGFLKPIMEPQYNLWESFFEKRIDPALEEEVAELLNAPLMPSQVGDHWYQRDLTEIPGVLNTWAAQVGDQVPILLHVGLGEVAAELTGRAAGPAHRAVKTAMGMAIGGTYSIALETGGFWDYAQEVGIDKDLAEKYARLYGVSAGPIEYSQNVFALKPITNIMGKIPKVVQKKVIKFIARELGTAISEGVEEFTQNSLEKYFMGLAIDEMRSRYPDWAADKPDILEGGLRAFMIGAGVATITRGIGNISRATYNTLSTVEKKKVDKYGVKIEDEPSFRGVGATGQFGEPVPKGVGKEEIPLAKIETGEVVPVTKQPWEMTKEELSISKGFQVEALPGEDIARAESDGTITVDPDKFLGHSIEDRKDIIRHEQAHFIEEKIKPEDKAKYFDVLAIMNYRGRNINEKLANMIQDGKIVPEVLKDYPYLAKLIPEVIKPKEIKSVAKAQIDERMALAEKIEDVKLRNEVQLGKAKIGDFIKEEKAVIISGKKIEEAGRKGLVVGKKVGVEKEKIRKGEIEARAKGRKAVRKYIEKLATKISAPVGKSVDFYYREVIGALQGDIDPNFRMKKTLEARDRIRKFLEKYPEKTEDMPRQLLETLQKKSLNEVTIAELEEIAKEIEHLKAQGRLKRKLTVNQQNRQFESDRDEMVSNILGGKGLKPPTGPIIKSTAEEGKIKKAARFARAITLRPVRIFHKLDGGKEGRTYQRFWNDVNVARNNELREMDKRLESGKIERKELSIKLGDLAKTREIDGFKYSVDEILDVYAGFKNVSKQLAIMHGNKIDIDTANKIIATLTSQEKALAEFIIEDYENRYGVLREAHIDFMNEDLGYEKNYTPIRRTEIDYSPLNEELAQELLQREHLRHAYAERGFTISRKDIPEEFQKPIRLGLYSTWLDQVPKQEHYISHAQLVKELQRTVRDKTFSEAVKQKYGDEYLKVIRNYVDRVANPNIYKSYHGLENLSRTLRQHTALAYLSYNIVTMGKQLPSVFLYLAEAGPVRLLGSAIKFTTNPFKMIKEVNAKDPQMKHRSIERELEELKSINRNAYDKILKKVGKTGMVGIYAMDKIAITIGWNAVYQKSIHAGLSENEARQKAQTATLKTQPAAHAKDVAELYATSEWVNLFTQFTNQLNQIYNIATYDIPTTFKDHQYYKVLLQTTGLGITALMIWTMTKRRLPKEPEDFQEAITDQMINSIPLVGRQIYASKEGWRSELPPAFKPAIATGIALRALKKMAKGKSVTDYEINAIIEAVSIATGMPYTGVRRLLKTLDTGEISELIGGKPRK